MKKFTFSLSMVVATLMSFTAMGQLLVTPNNNAVDLANALIAPGSGVTISAATYTGGANSAGTFSDATVGITSGVLLTSGLASIAIGPNNAAGAGAGVGFPGDPDLNVLSAPFVTFDAAILEITFIPDGDVLEFTYVFASEEYDEYVCSSFNDVFGFFVTGGVYSNTNIALLPGTVPPVPVTINNVNNGSIGSNGNASNCTAEQLENAAFYISNAGGLNTQYDGMTIPLSASLVVVPGTEYTIRLAIADAGDSALDSGVFIEGESFVSFVCDLDAGQISAGNSNICSNQDDATLEASLIDAIPGEASAWFLTDASGEILSVQDNGTFDFSGFEEGISFIYNVTWTGTLSGLAVGNDLADIAGICFDLTAPHTVHTQICEDEEEPSCDGFDLFYANIHSGGVTDIYRVDLDGTDANLTLIATSPVEVHIAYSEADQLIYAVRKSNGSYQTLDPITATFSPAQTLGSSVSDITTAVINADNKLLIGSAGGDKIYQVDLGTNAVVVYDDYAPVDGGDLAVDADGALYLATKTGSALYQVFPDDFSSDVMLGNTSANVTGMAITDGGQLILSHAGATTFELRDTNGSNPGTTYAVKLDGNPFTTASGDMASGCFDDEPEIEDCDYKLYYVHKPVTGNSTLFEVTLNNDNTTTMTSILANPGDKHIAISPDGSTLYIVGGGNTLQIFDVNTATIIDTKPMLTGSGTAISSPPAAVCGSDGTLYVATGNKVYTIDTATGLATQYGPNRTVNGGDLIFAPTGTDDAEELWLITRSDDRITNVLTGTFMVLPATEINGAVILENGHLLVSDGNGAGLFKEINLDDLSIVATYETGLALHNGDLAGICTGGNPSEEGCLLEAGACYATSVVYVQGLSSTNGPIAANRTVAANATGAPQGTDNLVFVSLGYGGSVTLQFDGSVVNGPGADIQVIETTFNNPVGCNTYREYADVSVSEDGTTYYYIGTVCKSDNMVDISDAEVELDCVTHVRVSNNNDLTTTPDGFDVDGVIAIHNCDGPAITNVADGDSFTITNELTSYPNPTTGPSVVTFTTAVSGRASLEVYDMNGRMIASILNQDVTAGVQYREDFNALSLPNGIYIYRLTTNNEVTIEKFMVSK